jgi:tRNA dimethylallyltransferase
MSRFLPVVFLLGPTAVGKSAVAIALAQRLAAEIVSADSRLLYRGMDIGTAKPSRDARARVRHHLIDVADPEDTWSLAQYRQAALAALAEISARGHLPLVVGGTGQYVRALVQGWSPAPRPLDDSLRQELEAFARENGPKALHDRLAALDPASAARIDARNVRRVARAVEVTLTTGRPASAQRAAVPPPFPVLPLGLRLPREELYARVDARVEAMLAEGWLEEVRLLLAGGLRQDHPAMSAIGYRPLAHHLLGRCTLDQARVEIRRSTRVLVRRQANWFKASDTGIAWFEARPGVDAALERHILAWLGSLTVETTPE